MHLLVIFLYQFFEKTFLVSNLFSYEETKKIIEKNTPDIVVNCAAKVGGIVANNTNRTDFILNNLKINMNIIESISFTFFK